MALILATNDSAIVDLAHGKDVTLCHDSINDLESQSVNEVQHLFFCANEEHIVDYERVPHVFNVQGLYLASVTSLEDIDLVLAVDN